MNVNTGSVLLYYQGKVNGRGIRRALGDVEVVSLLEARAAVNRLRYDRSTAGILAPRPSGDAAGDESPILASVVDDMLAARAAGRWLPGRRRRQGPPTERTTQFYEDLMNATTTAHETLTLQGFADKLLDIYSKLQAKAPVQANRALQLWRNIFTVATDSGLWRGANPAVATSGTSRMTQTPEIPRQRVLTDAEWKRLDAAMVKDDPLWRDLSTLSIRSLQRMGACCRARWSDISLTGNDAAWRTPAADMKGRAGGAHDPAHGHAGCGGDAQGTPKARAEGLPLGVSGDRWRRSGRVLQNRMEATTRAGKALERGQNPAPPAARLAEDSRQSHGLSGHPPERRDAGSW